MTKLLCLEDSYLKECDSTVLSVNGKEVVFDQTVFYPRGGGQPSDFGKIVHSNEQFTVVNVSKKDGIVVHELDRDCSLPVGVKVHCTIDWERRYKLMRMHTAAHTLAATMHKEFNILITGNQLETDKTRFDFSMENFDREKFDLVIKKANEALQNDIELKVYTLPREEAMKIPGVVKLAVALPPSIDRLRIVEIPGIDLQADGGTHVKNTREVGQLSILKLDNKGKDNKRIYYTLSDTGAKI
ncbi:alanyl-tRNA editing protein [Candidatus Micrarchaeota archaeon]|nr:alanyl-tRNA editing protein [Candidatus Micrarchaeota archaeon]